MRKYFLSQISEIQNNRSLSLYGAAICMGYFYFWVYLNNHSFDFKLSFNDEAICWPFFNACDFPRIFSPTHWKIIFLSLCVASTANAVLFLVKRVRTAYTILILLECLRISIILIDYRVRLNQNYMFSFIVFAFLFISQKSLTIPRLLVLFYFWAGILKLTPDWLSGSALYGKLLFIPDSLKVISAQYVVVLELFITPFLLSKNKVARYLVLFQLGLFHLVSLGVVGFFYPALMVSLLSIFILLDFFPPNPGSTPASSFGHFGGLGIVILFSILNCFPYFVPGDKSITGETRLVSLHMFDSITYCTPWSTLKFRSGVPEKKNLYMPNVIRIRCDPIVYLSRLRKICRDKKSDPNFIDVDFTLDVTKETQKKSIRVMDITDFCSKNYQYSVWNRNNWINYQ